VRVPITSASSTSQSVFADPLGNDDVVIGPDDAGGRLVEQHWLLRHGLTRFGGVVGVVEADHDKVAHARHAGADPRRAAHSGQGFGLQLHEARQSAGAERIGVDLGDHLAEIAQLPSRVDQSRFFLARFSISNEFHVAFRRVLSVERSGIGSLLGTDPAGTCGARRIHLATSFLSPQMSHITRIVGRLHPGKLCLLCARQVSRESDRTKHESLAEFVVRRSLSVKLQA
jgi:hypothetical protein